MLVRHRHKGRAYSICGFARSYVQQFGERPTPARPAAVFPAASLFPPASVVEATIISRNADAPPPPAGYTDCSHANVVIANPRTAAPAMAKGVLTALAVMLMCTVIPIANVLLAPFGPFLGAYFGIRSRGHGGARAAAGGRLIFGCAVGMASALILAAIAIVLTLALPIPRPVRDSSLDRGGSVLGLRSGHEHAGRPLPLDENPKRRCRSGVRNGLNHGTGGALDPPGRGA